VAAELSKVGTCVALPADLAVLADVKRLAGELAAREPALHILVNNAGANWGAPIEEYPDAAWDKVLALNVKSVFHLTVALLPQLAAAATAEDPARVINIGSIDGISVPALETYAYSASKAAVHHLTRVLARKLASRDITVNAVAPGPFESKMMAATLEKFRDALERRIRASGSVRPKTWRASRSTSPRAREPTSPEPSSRSTAGCRRRSSD
jgi:NAD(P)-dependent dehydrogenase (short-subunit alcohol dehydrogenase family)